MASNSKKLKIIIVGGCFDILHPGHLDFLSKAKKLADKLIVLLEPDEKVRLMKGKNRPKNNLELRIKNLEKTNLVDKIIVLPMLKTDGEYRKTIVKLLNCYIAEKYKYKIYFGITKDDRNVVKNEKIRTLEKKLGVEVIEVNKLLPEFSTTKLID